MPGNSEVITLKASALNRPLKATSMENMAGATGLEPAASYVTGRRSNQLNYAPALKLHRYLFLLLPFNALAFPIIPQKCRDSQAFDRN